MGALRALVTFAHFEVEKCYPHPWVCPRKGPVPAGQQMWGQRDSLSQVMAPVTSQTALENCRCCQDWQDPKEEFERETDVLSSTIY